MPTRPPLHRPFPLARPNPVCNRPSAAKRGYDRVWRTFRAAFLHDNPLCIDCERRGIVTPATHVDHEPALTGPDDPGRLDSGRCRSMCASCHSRKTCRQDGGRPR
jgi:5-methylcytosine-specific restriction protein A